MKVRRSVLVLLVILAVALTYQVQAFLSAEIKNKTTLDVTNPEQAIVAFPDDLVLFVEQTVQVTSDESALTEESLVEVTDASHNVEITNHSSRLMTVRIECDMEQLIIDDLVVSPGLTERASIQVAEDLESGLATLIIHASWEGGTADIRTPLSVKVHQIETFESKGSAEPSDLVEVTEQGLELASPETLSTIGE
ncbi:MAG: hypothetical protein EOM08_02670 [Clostridia bacterium]|nr:hypothetical protein [Clostridia bacterium]NCC75320.1 hypothetical protein [Clostridia bacterium]